MPRYYLTYLLIVDTVQFAWDRSCQGPTLATAVPRYVSITMAISSCGGISWADCDLDVTDLVY